MLSFFHSAAMLKQSPTGTSANDAIPLLSSSSSDEDDDDSSPHPQAPQREDKNGVYLQRSAVIWPYGN
jgi:hypothetical protein